MPKVAQGMRTTCLDLVHINLSAWWFCLFLFDVYSVTVLVSTIFKSLLIIMEGTNFRTQTFFSYINLSHIERVLCPQFNLRVYTP